MPGAKPRVRTRLGAFLCFVLLGLMGRAAAQETTATVVARMPLAGESAHYTPSRPPLRPTPGLRLPIGAVKARGWLLECLKRQRAGMVGHLGSLSAWLQKADNAWLAPDGKGKWGWEEVPYWLKGYAELAYLLEDERMLAETRVWIEGALASQREDGNFGPVRVFKDDGSQDFWANMVMLFCLQAHHEHAPDQRVLDLMRRYFAYQLTVPDELFLTHHWQRMRGGDNLHSVYWLYDRIGEPWLLDLAEKIHRNTAPWGLVDDLPSWHNVNIAQGFREPATFYRQSHDRDDLDATYRAFHRVRQRYGQVPGGMFGGDEVCRPGKGDPRQAIETCGVAEQMASDELLFAMTGDPFWAEHCEDVAFNTWPVSFTPDHRALRYLTAPNHVVSDARNHAPGIFNRGPFLVMNPLSHRCCQHNHSHGWTSFTKSLWTATLDGGLCAAMYAPSRVEARVGPGEGALVRITSTTRYPFEETISLTIEPERSVAFPLYLRIPAWCREATVAINGEKVEVKGGPLAGAFVRLARRWQQGDQLRLSLPMEVEVERWVSNHDSVSIRRGPLVYSLEIAERYEKRSPTETALRDSRWQETVNLEEWPAFEILPDSPWNYGLLLSRSSLRVEQRPWPDDDYPFTQTNSPIVLHATGRRVPEWRRDRFGLAAELQDGPVLSRQPDEPIKLVPMGAARLRVSAFPVIAEKEKGVAWTPPVTPRRLYRVRVSHCYHGDTKDAVADGLEPASSGDHDVERHTFWPRKGTTEWLEAHFDRPREIRGVGVYWFDDRAIGGGCRVPEGWKLLARVGGEWKRLAPDAEPGVARDRFNELTFDPVVTSALRLEVKLQPESSAGVLEWRIDPPAPERSGRSGPWPVKRAQEWWQQQSWLAGCNFLPSSAINQVEMWSADTFDAEAIDRELGWAAGIGFNCMRVYLHDLAYEQDPSGFLERMERYLTIAHSHGIRTLFVFFDDCWMTPSALPSLVPEPLPGVHNSGWLQSPGRDQVLAFSEDEALQDRLRSYVQTVLRRFAKDARVLGWDLYNEPGNAAHLRRPVRGERVTPTPAASLALLEAAFDWAWEVDPEQPITSGVWTWIVPDEHPLARVQANRSDILSFHCYSDARGLQARIKDIQAYAKGRPLLCTEYRARAQGSTFRAALPILAREGIGAINWGLVAGKSNTIYPWSSWRTPGKLPEPELWFHDIFRRDGTPFDPEEIILIKRITSETRAARRSESGR